MVATAMDPLVPTKEPKEPITVTPTELIAAGTALELSIPVVNSSQARPHITQMARVFRLSIDLSREGVIVDVCFVRLQRATLGERRFTTRNRQQRALKTPRRAGGDARM
jgi:hypothetical protein